MPKRLRSTLVLGIVLSVPQVGLAQQSEHPLLNSIGRYFGVGYTKGGFHAAQDGRLDVISNRHPASNYRVGGLTRAPAPHFGSAVLTHSQPGHAGAASAGVNGAAEVVAPPKPLAPPKPVGPPPVWLENYLKDQPPGGVGAQRSQDKVPGQGLVPESSPSDLLLESTTEPSVSAQEITFSIVEPDYPSLAPSLDRAVPVRGISAGTNRYQP